MVTGLLVANAFPNFVNGLLELALFIKGFKWATCCAEVTA
jgi:hypothetical protein